MTGRLVNISRLTLPGISAVLLAALLFMVLGLPDSQAQFLRLTFEIESEFAAEEMEPLFFGEVVPNAGVIRIGMGDPGMGTYSISGPQNLMVDMSLDIPDYLEFEGDEEFRVPMDLDVAYANRNQNMPDQAVPITGGEARFPLREDVSQQQSPDDPVPSATAFIYVYGEIEVGDIPPGTYEAEVFLAVEYE